MEDQEQEQENSTALLDASNNAESVFDAVSESLKPSFSSSLDPVLVKQVSDAFSVFESNETGAVDVREVGTIIRSLGCCPSEAELQQMVIAMEGDSTNHFVTLEKFVPVVCGVLQQKRFQSASEDLVLRAFRTLDTSKKGYLTRSELETALIGSGEPFSADEMEEMWTAIRSLEQTSRPTTALRNVTQMSASHLFKIGSKNDNADEDDAAAQNEPQEIVDYATYAKFMMK